MFWRLALALLLLAALIFMVRTWWGYRSVAKSEAQRARVAREAEALTIDEDTVEQLEEIKSRRMRLGERLNSGEQPTEKE